MVNQHILQDEQRSVSSSSPFVSVIIPVFNDEERLKICLEALGKQTYPKSHYEIIVIDNGSDSVQQVESAVYQWSNAIATQECLPGSYAARNKGLALAKGEVFAFTDADCIPAPNWLEKGIYHLLHTPNCGLVAGEVELFFEDPDRPNAVELYESVTAFPQQHLLYQFRGGATANVFTWRNVVEQVGEFNGYLKSNGDLEWGKRVFLAGYEQVYAADVRVQHPARRSLAQLYKRALRIAGGEYDRYIKMESSFWRRNYVFLKTLLRELMPPIYLIITIFRNPKLKGIGDKIKVSLISIFIRYVGTLEKIRLKFGGVSQRG